MHYVLIILMIATQLFAKPVTVEIEALPEKKSTPKKVIPKVLMVDDFEDADLAKFREWWSFDKVMIKSKSNEKVKGIYIGNVSLEVNGSSNNWYAGGLGTYLNENAEYFRTLKLVIFSPKINSGAIRIELYDDDNNNKVVDINNETGTPSKDDLFIYDLNLVWEGWKTVTIPLKDFVDFNNDVGDNQWNPNQDYGSAGLIQMQLVVLSSKFKSETIAFDIDTIKFN